MRPVQRRGVIRIVDSKRGLSADAGHLWAQQDVGAWGFPGDMVIRSRLHQVMHHNRPKGARQSSPGQSGAAKPRSAALGQRSPKRPKPQPGRNKMMHVRVALHAEDGDRRQPHRVDRACRSACVPSVALACDWASNGANRATREAVWAPEAAASWSLPRFSGHWSSRQAGRKRIASR